MCEYDVSCIIYTHIYIYLCLSKLNHMVFFSFSFLVCLLVVLMVVESDFDISSHLAPIAVKIDLVAASQYIWHLMMFWIIENFLVYLVDDKPRRTPAGLFHVGDSPYDDFSQGDSWNPVPTIVTRLPEILYKASLAGSIFHSLILRRSQPLFAVPVFFLVSFLFF